MTQTIRLFLVLGAASFGSASLIHFGKLITGYDYLQANIAEA